ncbi:hypothetical protein BT63DRAFT_5938 [Microthyrium microscopicum]|uniref:Uncharacterized protein n=1 Tax=Microthyrium microscopicum TaxID=703497 RepID=A0A6A6UR70_9PEZI|nr:hypothetical protein BT63DRAFT_5938 [Microthyrium microscopicum]
MSESVILPDAPVVLVHRGWSSKNNGTERTTINVGSKALKTLHKPSGRKGVSSIMASSKPSTTFEFVHMYSPSTSSTRKTVGKLPARATKKRPRTIEKKPLKKTQETKAVEKVVDVEIANSTSLVTKSAQNYDQLSHLSYVCPGSATMFYGGGFPFKMNAQLPALINVCKIAFVLNLMKGSLVAQI